MYKNAHRIKTVKKLDLKVRKGIWDYHASILKAKVLIGLSLMLILSFALSVTSTSIFGVNAFGFTFRTVGQIGCFVSVIGLLMAWFDCYVIGEIANNSVPRPWR